MQALPQLDWTMLEPKLRAAVSSGNAASTIPQALLFYASLLKGAMVQLHGR